VIEFQSVVGIGVTLATIRTKVVSAFRVLVVKKELRQE
tara:strand:- start:9 stop:122 length:114 start_codon:yes stop_codon:yes gene_type:complete